MSPDYKQGVRDGIEACRNQGLPAPDIALDVAAYTSAEVADLLGVSDRRVRALIKSRKVGRKIAGRWVLTPREVDEMRDRPNGVNLKYRAD